MVGEITDIVHTSVKNLHRGTCVPSQKASKFLNVKLSHENNSRKTMLYKTHYQGQNRKLKHYSIDLTETFEGFWG
jgi:hypothetical protein